MAESKSRMNTKNGHYWVIEPHVKYISRGTCKCGAVRFFANEISKEAISLAEKYNREEGKEGHGHMVTQKDPPEAVAKNDETSPAPPRPKRRGQRIQYFEENKEAILQDYQNLKLKEFYNKWHMTSATWTKLKRDWKLPGKMPRKSTPRPQTHKSGNHKGPPSLASVVDALKKSKVDKLPSFPEWAPEKWASSEIAVQWLRTYEALQGMRLVMFLSQNSESAPAVPAAKAKRGNWLRRLFKQ